MFFETKATREKWLDRFAVSNLPIDVFCEMNHIKKEMLIEILIRLGKAIIVLPVGIRQEQLVTILKAVTEV